MSLALGVLVDVFLAETAEEHTVETGVKSIQMSSTQVTYT